jgi:hypothetical protein
LSFEFDFLREPKVEDLSSDLTIAKYVVMGQFEKTLFQLSIACPNPPLADLECGKALNLIINKVQTEPLLNMKFIVITI